MSSLQPVVFVDGARTPFARAGSLYAHTRADDLMVKVIRELMRRNPSLPPERIDDIAVAAATQTGDQGMNIGRSVALLSGLPSTVPGYSIDRWCAGAMTAVTTLSASIMAGAYDVAIAGGVEHMTHHPMGEGIDPNPRYLAEKLVDMETAFRFWRFRHVSTVERIIGFKTGTGGTAGVSYLRKMLDVVLFPELFALRTAL